MLKRLFDFLIALFGLAFLSPLLAFLAWQLRSRLGSPVFFCQLRPGLRGKPFQMVKF
jgi:lipopolysaccharide/colanic/teichoic acid biosynthesis glycosyltransferase